MEQQLTMRRVWAMPSHDTFTVKPIKELIAAHITHEFTGDPQRPVECRVSTLLSQACNV